MFKSLRKYIVNKWQTSDTLRKAVFTGLIICVYKMLSYIPLAFIDRQLVSRFVDNSVSQFNIFANSGIEKFSIVSLSIMPYISSSILMQLLSSNIGSDAFRSLKNDNEQGATTIEMYTKYLTIVISLIHGGYTLWEIFYMKVGGLNLVNVNMFVFFFVNLFNIVTGSLICIWLSNLISKKGIGNGVNTIIFVNLINDSIRSNLDVIAAFKNGMMSLNQLLVSIGFIIFMFVFAIIVDNAAYKIKIHPLGIANNEQMKHLKIKLNSSGVMTVILANYISSIPTLIKTFLQKIGYLTSNIERVLAIVSPNTVGNLIFLTVILVFTSLNYSSVALDLKEMTKQLQENNVMVTPGDRDIRPGMQTYQYINSIINNWINAAMLIIIFIGSQVFSSILESEIGFPVIKINGLSILLAVSTAKSLFLNIVSYSYSNISGNYYQSDRDDVSAKIRQLQQKKYVEDD